MKEYKKISFTSEYNEKIIWLPDTTREIMFEVEYEYPLDNLPHCLIKLVCMFKCNQLMDNLPLNIKIIYFGQYMR